MSVSVRIGADPGLAKRSRQLFGATSSHTSGKGAIAAEAIKDRFRATEWLLGIDHPVVNV